MVGQSGVLVQTHEKRILVTGATGYVGGRLVTTLRPAVILFTAQPVDPACCASLQPMGPKRFEPMSLDLPINDISRIFYRALYGI